MLKKKKDPILPRLETIFKGSSYWSHSFYYVLSFPSFTVLSPYEIEKWRSLDSESRSPLSPNRTLPSLSQWSNKRNVDSYRRKNVKSN